tara:strand:+ start:4920 stop:5477 length:558 start_codon:yes stop_codon:yes gene_type:complete
MVNKSNTRKLTPTLLEEIRNKFVQGIEANTGGRKLFTIDQLATDYGIPKPTLYKHAKKDDWTIKQKQFQDAFLIELDARRRKELVQESINFDKTSLAIAKGIMGQIGKVLSKNAAPDKDVQPQTLVGLSSAATNAQKVAKLALGETTDNMEVITNVQDSDSFRRALERLDRIAEDIRETDSSSVH